MNSWFYSHNDEQKGPVSKEELARLASTGEFSASTDLVWREGMGDWQKVAEVPELNLNPSFSSAVSPVPGSHPATNDPYQTPASGHYPSELIAEDELPEIEPGSAPLAINDCIGRAFKLTKRYFGIIIAAWAIYFGISIAISVIFGIGEIIFIRLETVTSIGGSSTTTDLEPSAGYIVYEVFTQIISQIVSLFFTLGLIRIGLNLISGKPVEIAMLFKEGSQLIRGILGALLYALIVTVGVLLLIVPGIYWALKYSHYSTAIVDKNMGVMEAFRYSASLTQNNKMALLGLGILCLLINIAGMVAFCFGLIFTIPLTWLAWLVGYRWLQQGPATLQDRGLHRL